MRGALAGWLLLVAGVCSACGASQPESPEDPPSPELVRLENDVQRAADELSQVLWAAPQDETQRAETSRRARCVWDELTRAGHDPVPELECLVLRMRASTRCYAATPPGETPRCEDAYASACPASAELTRVAETTCAPRAAPSRP